MNDQRAWALFAAVVACFVGVRVAAQPQGPQLTPNYRDADIRMVADQVQQVIGRPIIIDPRVRAQVTVLSNAPMSPDAFYRLFLSTLEVHGYQALDSGGAIQIVPDANARFGGGDNYVTQAIVLDNIGAPNLVAILRPLLPQSAHLASHGSSNALIIADTPANVRRMVDLVRRIDVAGTQEVEVIALENASAEEVVRMLSALNQAAQAAGGAPPIQVIADMRTNSVLLSGAGLVRVQTRALIAHLDTPSAQGGDTLVRYLNYADAEDLAEKLQAQFGGSGAAPAAPEGGAPINSGPITIWADPGTNALVINAPERVREDMHAIINQIDIPRLQVQVDAIIVELSEEKAAQLGVTWLSAGDDGDRVLGLTNFSNAGGGGIIGLAGQSAGDTPNLAAIAEGITVGVGKISDGGTSWAALLNALRGDGETNIVSTPQIVTLDNEEAEISVGQEVPFLSGQFTNTGANQGSVNPFQTIQREPVGTRLKIVPQINEGSGLKLEIEQETSSLSSTVQGAADLVTNTRTITTSVFVNDGEVLVLGGLIDDQLRESERRVPGLSRIPGLGWLFRSRKADRKKTNLMVFIRPTILRDAADARFQTNAKYRYIQDLQRQMAEGGVRLMRGDEPPTLPPLPETQTEPESNVAPSADGNQPR
ncbi:MAG TPA: type II secretion system secretin GspD [Gammaproteobacteria bacterium]|nr:type II secretion system secretin GspD [Gammaproteobacteria bacterium]